MPGLLRHARCFWLAVLLGACSPAAGERAPDPERVSEAAKVSPASAASVAPLVPAPTPAAKTRLGDADRGAKLVLEFECHRCHDATGHPAMAREKHCTHCHEDIATSRFGAGTSKITQWKRSVAPYRWAPSLLNVGRRLRQSWVRDFLQDPYDVRPNLAASMPRLAISPEQAEDIAAYVTRGASAAASSAGSSDEGRVEAGRSLLEQRGCGSCHVFTGVAALPSQPRDDSGTDATRKGIALAPDLRHVRDRFRGDALVDWLVAPASLKADTSMPTHSLTRNEAIDLAAYLVRAELSPPPSTPAGPRLPILSRAVGYREVEERVLASTCRHCHGNPDVAGGDGGPGNTGGFGFAPRGLDLSTYRSAASGYVGDDHERHSLFERGTDGTPRLVLALIARREEEAGRRVPGVRGMPLGLPSVSAEDVQLVETWIAQGRPR